MTRTYFNRKRAENFAEKIRSQGFEAEIWSYKDGFGQTVYSVEYREKEKPIKKYTYNELAEIIKSTGSSLAEIVIERDMKYVEALTGKKQHRDDIAPDWIAKDLI